MDSGVPAVARLGDLCRRDSQGTRYRTGEDAVVASQSLRAHARPLRLPLPRLRVTVSSSRSVKPDPNQILVDDQRPSIGSFNPFARATSIAFA